MQPQHALDGLLSSFSSHGGARFALATPDGRVRTYDTVSGRLSSSLSVGASKDATAAADSHLAEGQQCLTWVDSEELAASAAAEARSSNPAGPSHSWLAVGTSAGAVKCYDSATGELRWATPNLNEGGVTCLAYSTAHRGHLLSSGPDGQAVSLDAHSGRKLQQFRASKHGASAAALSEDGSKLLLGGSTLTVWDLETQQRIARLTGHPLPVRALCFSPDATYAVSAAVGERLTAVWVVPQPGSKKKAGGVAAASLAVAQPVVQLATAAAGDAEPTGSFYAAATTEAAEVYVWLVRPKGESGVDAHQVARLAVDPKHKQQEVIFAAALEHTAVGATLVVAVGTAAKPRFERVPMGTKPIKSSKITHLQPPPNSQGLIQAAAGAVAGAVAAAADVKQGSGSGKPAAEVLGADNAGQLVQQRQSKASKKRSEPEQGRGSGSDDEDDEESDGDDDSLANGVDGMDTEEEQELAGEPTLGQRVFELEKQQRDQQQQQQGGGSAVQAAAAAAAGDDEAAAAGAGAALPAGPLKADSLAVLLSQALRSSDRALLERCLAVGRERVISNSVRRLVPMDAALLLQAAVERLQSKPSRGQQLAAWIHAVLLHHTAYLMSAPAAAPLMSSLYQVIEARLAMQRQLLSLAGRLELLLAQRGPAEAAGAGGAAGGAAAQVVYEESDSEAEVEIVDAAAGASSDDDDADEFTTDDGDEMSGDDDGDDDGSDDDGSDGGAAGDDMEEDSE